LSSIQIMIFLNGLTHGGLLFIMASGFTLAFGLMRVVNLAHGAFYLLGGYIGVTVFRASGSWFLAVLVGGASIGLLGLLKERFLLVRVRGKMLSESLMTIGLAIILADLCLLTWGGHPMSIRVPPPLNMPVRIFGITYPGFRLFVLGCAIAIGIGLWLLLQKTKIGAMVRAGVDDRETAAAMGININKIFTIIFLISALLAGMSGVFGASFTSLQQGVDSQVLILALVVVIIGGMGSLFGAGVGALLTGLVLSYARAYIPELSFLFTFLPMAVILAIRPQGLFGRST